MLRTLAAASAACVAVSAHAAVPTAILQTSGTGANSFVDGPSSPLQFAGFDRPVKSGTGSYWIMLARNTLASAGNEMFITGSGTSYNLVALEGVTEFEPGRTFASIDRYVDINATGDWVGIGNLIGGATTDDEVVYAGNFDGSTLSLPQREGGLLPGGFTAGTANYGPSITDAGQVGAVWSVAGVPSANDIAYFSPGGAAVLQEGISVPGNQRGGTSFALASPFSGRNATQFTSDGASYVTVAELSNGDEVLIKNGDVGLQEGDAFGTRILSDIAGEQNILQDNGDWLTRVRFSDGTGGAIKNGTLLAASGDLVGGTIAGERWSEVPWTSSSDTTFFIVTGDNAGNVVLGGFTDAAENNFVWTYNGQEFLRAGDQLDLDADGALDDAFITFTDFFSASPEMLGGFLADDGYFYSNVAWTNGAGTAGGDAFVRVLIPEPTSALLLAGAGLLGIRRRR